MHAHSATSSAFSLGVMGLSSSSGGSDSSLTLNALLTGTSTLVEEVVEEVEWEQHYRLYATKNLSSAAL